MTFDGPAAAPPSRANIARALGHVAAGMRELEAMWPELPPDVDGHDLIDALAALEAAGDELRRVMRLSDPYRDSPLVLRADEIRTGTRT